jgi:hypothetical protein
MLMLALLWLLAPLFLIALGVAGCFAIAIIIEGVAGLFRDCD